MRKIFSAILSVILLFSLISCSAENGMQSDSNSDLNSNAKVTYESIDFEFQCIRTEDPSSHDWFREGTYTWITDKNQLDEYYSKHQGEGLLFNGSMSEPLSNRTKDFVKKIKKYDDAFFEKKNLLILWLYTSSGSTTTEVTDILIPSSSNGKNKHLLQPMIKQKFGGTEDVGYWNLIIELDKKYSPDNCEPQKPYYQTDLPI